jgi:hypothetical protein
MEKATKIRMERGRKMSVDRKKVPRTCKKCKQVGFHDSRNCPNISKELCSLKVIHTQKILVQELIRVVLWMSTCKPAGFVEATKYFSVQKSCDR